MKSVLSDKGVTGEAMVRTCTHALSPQVYVITLVIQAPRRKKLASNEGSSIEAVMMFGCIHLTPVLPEGVQC